MNYGESEPERELINYASYLNVTTAGNLYSNYLAENTLTFNIQSCIWRLQAGWVSTILILQVIGPVFQYQSPGTEARHGGTNLQSH